MHPVPIALMIVGYALALPILGRLSAVMAEQQRLALLGHQAGIVLAMLGWGVQGIVVLVVAHAVWLVVTRVWFLVAGRRARSRAATG